MMEAYTTGDCTKKEIAAHFNVHHSTVSRTINKAETIDMRLQHPSLLRELMLIANQALRHSHL